ncbi:MAG TPA: FAD-dependent monooxygenase [Nitrosomonas halophila]|nr:FAD-dependent monooxygenase [Nitrosomonas halophila]
MTDQQFDVIIAGGGPVGMALALALTEYELSVLLLEARKLPENVSDPRPLALSYGSHLLLQRLGVWEKLTQATPITTIHISNRGHFGHTVLTTDEAGVPALGYVVNYHDLYESMRGLLQARQVNYQTGAQVSGIQTNSTHAQVTYQQDESNKLAQSSLLVLADGGRLAELVEGISYHVHDYQQWAVVSNVRVEAPERGAAFERFTLDGPLALLPSGDDYALVWTMPAAKAEPILQLDDQSFLTCLHDHFGDRMGSFIRAGKRSGFPLALKYASAVTSQRTVLIGNAAQTLHPVAGQGFNLGLRDAWELVDEIRHMPAGVAGEPGSARMLAMYNQRRRRDKQAGRLFTDSLVKLFTADIPLCQTFAGLGLAALDCLPPVKRFVARRMIFGARG